MSEGLSRGRITQSPLSPGSRSSLLFLNNDPAELPAQTGSQLYIVYKQHGLGLLRIFSNRSDQGNQKKKRVVGKRFNLSIWAWVLACFYALGDLFMQIMNITAACILW